MVRIRADPGEDGVSHVALRCRQRFVRAAIALVHVARQIVEQQRKMPHAHFPQLVKARFNAVSFRVLRKPYVQAWAEAINEL
jgi:hypothetical protein